MVTEEGCGYGSDVVIVTPKCRLNQKISHDTAQNTVFLQLYSTVNIVSFVLKTYNRPMWCDVTLFLHYGRN